ncbi:SOS response-associated protein YedK [Myxococcaceae bacterium]|jgi:putative SOS response-associated peptidase YedK|nr:SOS response-associated protein YedK [Myxococcaceae bacterium]
MCGRYTLGARPERIAATFGLDEILEFSPRFNIAPTQHAPVIVVSSGRRKLELRRFGLVPFFAKDASIGSRLINARSESVAEKPAFRSAFRKHRCLVPADGFYEWKPEGRRKQPYWMHRSDGAPFAMAGLCERWHPDREDEIRSFAILTTAANALVRRIHDRMPAILAPEDLGRWLDPGTPIDELRDLLAPAPESGFVARPVATLVNGAAFDDPRCIEPLQAAPRS